MRNAKSIADLALRAPSSIPILERLGIDYGSDPDEDVKQACRRAGVTTEELMNMIESQRRNEAISKSMTEAPKPV